MAKVLECDSKKLLKEAGIPVPQFAVAENPEQAVEKAEEIGLPVVLKALVPVGKRGKAGAIKFADTFEQVSQETENLLSMVVRNFPVNKVLVESKLDIKQELYASVTIDRIKKEIVILFSSSGGMDVEELSLKQPQKLVREWVNPLYGIEQFKFKEICCKAGFSGKLLRQLADILFRLYKVFTKYDCSLLEINPLVITSENQVIAAASVMSVDDSALYRHPELSDFVEMGSDRAWRPLTELEKQVVEVNEADPYRGTARYTEMDGGDIGFMCGGGGGSLLMFDALRFYGGEPANYTEFGGNPPERKVYGLTKGIISKPGVKGLIVSTNITNNTQVDIVAQGIVRALKDSNIDLDKFPVIVRIAGVKDLEGKKIFEEAGVEYHGDDITMVEAAKLMMEKMRRVYG